MATVNVVFHGLFAIFREKDHVRIRLPYVKDHFASVGTTSLGTTPRGVTYELQGVLKDGKANILDPKGTIQVLTFASAPPTTFADQAYFCDIVMPTPHAALGLSGGEAKNKFTERSGSLKVNHHIKTFTDMFALVYEVDPEKVLQFVSNIDDTKIPIKYSIMVKSGPVERHDKAHRIDAFEAGYKCIKGADVYWDGEIEGSLATSSTHSHGGHHAESEVGIQSLDPPGCSASSGSDNCGC